jgi:hypothetical protein
MVKPVNSEDECAFLLEPEAFGNLRERRTLEQVSTQLLGREVWIAEQTDKQ